MYMKHGSAEKRHLQQDIVEISTEPILMNISSQKYSLAFSRHVGLRRTPAAAVVTAGNSKWGILM
jgi:hypothetical protein